MVRQRKLLHWAAEYRRHGPLGALLTAEELRSHMKSIQPGWPDTELRRKDWHHHARMRSLLDRMAHAAIQKPRRRASR